MERMASCADELLKIAASKKEAPYQQTRTGRRPLRVETLLKKAAAPAPADITTLGKGLWSLLARHKKPLAAVGLGAAGMKGLEEGVIEPMQLGWKMKQQGYGG